MSTKRLIVESAVKAALREASGLKVISAEAIEWVNMQASCAVQSCAVHGRRTPGRRLMSPNMTYEVLVGPIRIQHGGDEPVHAPAINKAAIELLQEILRESRNLEDGFASRAAEIVAAAMELKP